MTAHPVATGFAAPDTSAWSLGPRGPWLAAALVAVVLYSVTLGGTYVYDDRVVVRDDPRVSEPGRWIEYFKQPYLLGAPDPLWRPLPCLSYALQWRIHGATAWPFHLVNILLHALVSALVAELAWRWTGERAAAYLAGILFAAHPVHVEAVAYIVGRAESMCTAGVVLGLILFRHRPLTVLRVLAILACFIFALGSKEHGLLLAPMILADHLVTRWCGQKAPIDVADRRAHRLLWALMCLTVLGYIFSRESIMHLMYEKWFLRWQVNPIVRSQGWDRLLVPLSVLGRYFGLLIAPVKLSPDRGAAVTWYAVRWNERYVYLGAAAVLGYVAALVSAVRDRLSAVLSPLLCVAISYALISNWFLIIGTIMGERLIYLTSVFFIILVSIVLANLRRSEIVAILSFLLSLMAWRTVSYAWQWNDALRLFSSARERFPQSVMLHVLEAEERMERGDLNGAAELLAEGREIVPEAQNVWALSAEVAQRLGRTREAAEFDLRAADLDENPPHMPRGSGRTQMSPPWLRAPATSRAGGG